MRAAVDFTDPLAGVEGKTDWNLDLPLRRDQWFQAAQQNLQLTSRVGTTAQRVFDTDGLIPAQSFEQVSNQLLLH
ncbi:MAG: hypothetical protein IID42_09005 [Planctomycetes bacterium]|nr:hypothetical protein [Planctomycetota bacterium]